MNHAACVAVVACASGVSAEVARLRHALVVDAVALSVHVQVVMTVEDGRHSVLHEEVMDRHRPTGPMLRKSRRSIRIETAPLEEGSALHPAAGLGTADAADEVMDEDERVARVRLRERALQPVILLAAERA